MEKHAFVGLRTNSLGHYLAGLGLHRVLAQQEDAAATLSWDDGYATIHTTIPDLTEWLIHEYKPSPILSPWNGGSGYGAKDKSPKVALDALVSHESPRFALLRTTHDQITQVMAAAGFERWDKARFLLELRNVVPDAALDWFDATVVLTSSTDGDVARFPGLGGTGGNDGRFEMSSNFHQRLADVLPELGCDASKSQQWLLDLLHDTQVQPLVPAAIGQFDPVGSGCPGSSSFGSAETLANPWLLVLLLEGLCVFAAGATRRLGEGSATVAAPFTVQFSAGGAIAGADEEEARSEIWAPLFEHPLTWRGVQHLFRQARTSWNGRTATKAAHMYAAVRAVGVNHHIDAFSRFGFVKRNGLAFTAVLLEVVDVAENSGIGVSRALERRTNVFRGQKSAQMIQAHTRAEKAMLEFNRTPCGDRLVQWLYELTVLENRAAQSASAKENISAVGHLLEYPVVHDVLEPEFGQMPEWRIAAALASCSFPVQTERDKLVWFTMRDLVLHCAPASKGKSWTEPVTTKPFERSVAELLSDVALWWSHQDRAEKSETIRGVKLPPLQRFSCHLSDTHAWTLGMLNGSELHRAFMAFLNINWFGYTARNSDEDQVVQAFNPALDLFIPFAQARIQDGCADVGDENAPRRALHPNWIRGLASGGSAAQRASREAATWRTRSAVVKKAVLPMPAGDVSLTTAQSKLLLAGLFASY